MRCVAGFPKEASTTCPVRAVMQAIYLIAFTCLPCSLEVATLLADQLRLHFPKDHPQ
jgi:hypothetical protein